MAYKPRENICENCHNIYLKFHKNSRFCNVSCAGIFNHRKRSLDPDYAELRERNAAHLREMNATLDRKAWSEKIGRSRRKKKEAPNNIFGCSSRTRVKILTRLEASCCVCGWKEDTPDLHHIDGKKIVDCDNHRNIALLCPNHHRLWHKGKIKRSDIKSFEEVHGSEWLKYYYG
jgi:hypothetical protein